MEITGSAVFSECGLYRYKLGRKWDSGSGCCNFLMMNPSTATAEVLDPTVNGCLKRAQEWGYNELSVTNIFSLRSTDPKGLLDVQDPVGPYNDAAIIEEAYISDLVVCAWGGCSPLIAARAEMVKKMIRPFNENITYLRMGKTGQPWHPLYIPLKEKPILWNI